MEISNVIQDIKNYYKGTDETGNAIDESTTRDKILYGNPNQKCTGIVTTCFASVDVIKDAIQKGANLIISHEALFWNHGDHTDWLEDNKVFQAKKELLDKHNLVVWRNHDYIHTGMPVDGEYVDGIFYGVMKELGWDAYLVGDMSMPVNFELPGLDVETVSQQLIKGLNIDGLRLIGDADTIIHRIQIPGHIMGNDNEMIVENDRDDIDALIALEVIDYTISEYIRDASQLGKPKVIFSVGHFNLEEPGMKYMLEYLPDIVGDKLPCYYSQSGDSFQYRTR